MHYLRGRSLPLTSFYHSTNTTMTEAMPFYVGTYAPSGVRTNKQWRLPSRDSREPEPHVMVMEIVKLLLNLLSYYHTIILSYYHT